MAEFKVGDQWRNKATGYVAQICEVDSTSGTATYYFLHDDKEEPTRHCRQFHDILGRFEPVDAPPAPKPPEAAKGERRFAFAGMRVRCLQGEYAGLLGTVTDARVMKNNCRVEFDGHEGCGVTFGLELGECLECLLEEQSRSLAKLPVTVVALPGTKPDPYEQHRLSYGASKVFLAAWARSPLEVSRRAHLVSQLAKELDRPAPVRFPHEGRSDRALPRSNGRG